MRFFYVLLFPFCSSLPISSVDYDRSPILNDTLVVTMAIDIYQTTFSFNDQILSMYCSVTLSWFDANERNEDDYDMYIGSGDHAMDEGMRSQWMPPVVKAIQRDSFRKPQVHLTHIHFAKNGTITAQIAWRTTVDCHQSSLWFPWDQWTCMYIVSHMEPLKMFSFAPTWRGSYFSINSLLAKAQGHEIVWWKERQVHAHFWDNDDYLIADAVQLEMTLRRYNPNLIASLVVPTTCLMFIEAFAFIAGYSVQFCAFLSPLMLIGMENVSSLLGTNTPYFALIFSARVILSSFTTILRISLYCLLKDRSDFKWFHSLFNTPLKRFIYCILTTSVMFCLLEYVA